MKDFGKTRSTFLILSACLLIAASACTNSEEPAVTHIPEGADPDIRKDLGYPPKEDDWSFEVSPGDSGWTYRFMMFEGAEPYLGTEVFESLPERFSEIPGVSEVEQEDRESYLIKSTLSQAELKTKLWSAFQSAASESFSE